MGPIEDNIATFVEVGRRKSISAAARHLGVPKSTVSRRLKRLEEELRVQLVHRDARRVVLTTEGNRFFDSVVDAIDALHLAIARIGDSAENPRGHIRLTAPGDYARMILVPHLVSFLERYPDISLDLLATNRFVDLVREGVDLAVRAGDVVEPNLIARAIAPAELALAASPKMRIACDVIGALQAYPFVLYRSRGRTQVIRLDRRGIGESVELAVSGRVSVDDYPSMVELVAAGQGIGLMPMLHIDAGEKTGRLVRLFPNWCRQSGQIHLVYPTRKLPERVRLLIDFLVAALSEPPGEQANTAGPPSG